MLFGPNLLFPPLTYPPGESARVSKTQSFLRIPAPRQESPGGDVSTKVVVTADNG